MARISQDAAYEAAKKIAEPLKVKAKALKKQLEKFVIAEYLKEVPKEVLNLWETHKSYIKNSSYLYVHGPGINHDHISFLNEDIPCSSTSITLDSKAAAIYVKLKNAAHDARKKYDDTVEEIKNTLLTLSTHKKIGEIMPNALRFLPETKDNTRELIVQIQPVVDKVNCLITNEDKCVDKL